MDVITLMQEDLEINVSRYYRPLWIGRNYIAFSNESLNTNSYSYLDRSAEDINYYRLKIIDRDGSYEYSVVRNIKIDCVNNKGKLSVFPNPIQANQGNLNVKVFSDQDQLTIHIIDMLGRIVKTSNHSTIKDWNLLSIDISNLPAGTYNVHVAGSKNTQIVNILE